MPERRDVALNWLGEVGLGRDDFSSLEKSSAQARLHFSKLRRMTVIKIDKHNLSQVSSLPPKTIFDWYSGLPNHPDSRHRTFDPGDS
jgi:hypothetical protein